MDENDPLVALARRLQQAQLKQADQQKHVIQTLQAFMTGPVIKQDDRLKDLMRLATSVHAGPMRDEKIAAAKELLAELLKNKDLVDAIDGLGEISGFVGLAQLLQLLPDVIRAAHAQGLIDGHARAERRRRLDDANACPAETRHRQYYWRPDVDRVSSDPRIQPTGSTRLGAPTLGDMLLKKASR